MDTKEGLRLKKEQELKILGMHCATCEVTVSRAISGVNGVKNTKVNLASGNAIVEMEGGKLADVVKAVRKAGYDVVTQKLILNVKMREEEGHKVREILEDIDGVISAKVNSASGLAVVELNPLSTSSDKVVEELKKHGYLAEVSADKVTRTSYLRELLMKLLIAAVVSPLTLIQVPLLQLIFSIPVVFYSGSIFHRGAFRAIKNRTTNMDVLVSLSSLTAWFYSFVSFLFIHSGYFFDAASFLITFILAGKALEAYIKERSSSEVIELKTIKATKENGEVVDSKNLKVGDLVVVKSGELIPADGVVESGEGFVDQSIYTGETEPVKRVRGDPVIGGSTLITGYLKVYVTRAGDRTYISQVVEALREAEVVRLPIQNLVDRISSMFVPSIIALSILTFLMWFYPLHQPLYFSTLIAIAVLASACPCGFGLATPMAVMVGIRKLLKKGIVIRNGESLERLKEVKTFVFDKTGTLTKGDIKLERYVEYLPGALQKASALESMSNHPVSKTISSLYKGEHKVESYTELDGGIYGKVDGSEVLIGKRELIRNNCEGQPQGDISICVGWKVAADIWLTDELREGVKDLIDELKERYKVIIATGDSSNFADRISRELGVELRKGLSPEDKVELINELKKSGPVAFVGDGVNDAQAIKAADVGIAVSTGTDLAKYAGDIIVPNISSIRSLIGQTGRTVRKIKENIAWALTYNAILVPIAAGALYPILGITLQPEYAALGMAMNSVSVVLWSFVQ